MPSQPIIVNVVQSSNPKGEKQSHGKSKGCGKKKDKVGKGNAKKYSNDTREGKNESKSKIKFT